MKLIEEAYQHATEVLSHCAKSTGFYASGLPGGYEATWARDSMVTSLGASLIDKQFQEPFQRSLKLLNKYQSELGQIPNAVGTYNIERKSDITYNSIDSTLWYLIGHSIYAKAYNTKELLDSSASSIEKAFLWLKYQDPNEDGLIVQQPTMDWQDAFPHKYGRVLNTLALYYGALTMFQKSKLATRIQKVVNGEIEAYLSLYDPKLGYYLPWIWKDHDGDREHGEWFDALGNLLAIVTGLATPDIAISILSYIEKKGINRPFPCKAIYPPFKKRGKDWHSYFEKCDAREPYCYLNAGIWPFIGGFYVAALVKTKQLKKAKQELENLAKANQEGISEPWGFQEWLHGQTGKAIGNSTPYQAWTAGMYLFAAECVKQKQIPFFV